MDSVQDSRTSKGNVLCSHHEGGVETLAGVPSSVGAAGLHRGGRAASYGPRDPGPSHAALFPLLTAEFKPLAQAQAGMAGSRSFPSPLALPRPLALLGTLPFLSLSLF